MNTVDDLSTPALAMTQAGLRYANGTVALTGVTFRLDAGEFVAVVGASGCGKSTLLRLAAGLLPATTGSVTGGAAQVGYVFQDPTLLPWRTVRGNVELAGELHGIPRAQRRAQAAAAIDRVGLSDVADQRPHTLSGGMRMRASLARTLTAKPDLLLFDEPFGAVDEITRGRLGDDLQTLFTTDRFAGLFVTHSIAEAVYLAGRVLVMSGRPGRVIGEVAVPLAYPRPPSVRFTAEFTALTARIHDLLRSADEPGGALAYQAAPSEGS